MAPTLLALAANRGSTRWSESRFQKMAANIPGMIFQFLRRPDSSESVLFASSGCWNCLRSNAETQANFSQLKALIHPDDRQAYEQSVAVCRHPTTLDLGGRIVPFWPTQVAAAFCPEQQLGDPLGWHMDVTERKQIEQPASSRSGNASEQLRLDQSCPALQESFTAVPVMLIGQWSLSAMKLRQFPAIY